MQDPRQDQGHNGNFFVFFCALILSPLLGTPENAGVMSHFHPLSGPQEGKGEATNSDFVSFDGDPQECTGYVAFPPTFGPLRRQG